MTLTEANRKIKRELLIIAADCADPRSRVGCDELTINAANRLLENVKALAAMRAMEIGPAP